MRPRQLIAAAVACVVALGVAATASAEPYLTVRTGAKCSDCHSNLTGGGKRTPFPYIHAHDVLRDLQILPLPARVKAYDGQLFSHGSLGGDFRVRNETQWSDNPDAQGRVRENRAFRGHVDFNDTDVQEFLLYGQLDLWPEVLSVYADADFTSGATTREVFGLLRGVLPLDGYVKAGRFFTPFGLALHDDEAFVRANGGTTFQNSDEGLELGIMPGPFFLAAAVTNGVQGDTDVQTAVNGYAVFDDVPVVRSVLAGASYLRQASDRYAAAWYAGTNLWRFTMLGEFVLIDDRSDTPAADDQYASYAEVDFLAFDWLNIRGLFEFLKVAGDRDRTRYAIGVEPFIDVFLQPRIQYRINNAPGSQPDLNTTELVFELHLWF
ncbi:MAG TPA: hypothetical protein VNO26_16170 [Candidatus Limnocylindria bacterium]|nr:hypothetical protein [Candidatus Limnocylindria bacterium]